VEPINAKFGMTHAEAREFIRNHFEEFVNKKNMQIGNMNFAADFVDHGADRLLDRMDKGTSVWPGKIIVAGRTPALS